MQNVADDDDFKSFQPPKFLPNRIQVQESLGGMGVNAVPRVDYSNAVQVLGQQVWRSRVGVPDDDYVDSHRLDGQSGIEQRLALLSTAAARGHVDNISAEDLSCLFEGDTGAGAGFIEQGNDDPSTQGRYLFYVPM